MLRPSILTRPVLVVDAHSDLKGLKDMRGAMLALPDPLSIVAMQGVQMLREAGLNPERDVHIKHTANHAAAVNHVISGEAAAVIVSDRALLQMPKPKRQAVRVLQTWDAGAVPGVVYLAGPQVPRERVERLQQAILEFVRDTREGRANEKSGLWRTDERHCRGYQAACAVWRAAQGRAMKARLAPCRMPFMWTTASRRRELQMHLRAFAANTPAGQNFMAQYRYGGFKPISATELKAMAVYADQAKRLLAGEK